MDFQEMFYSYKTIKLLTVFVTNTKCIHMFCADVKPKHFGHPTWH